VSLHARAAQFIRRSLRVIDAVDPSLRGSDGIAPPAQLLCVYRKHNARLVSDLVAECRGLTWPVYLHALDAPSETLAAWTVSEGPGGRFELLNRLAHQTDPRRWTIICDDDVRFPHRGIGALVERCSTFGLDVAQPAHRADSYYNWRFTRRRPGVQARVTGFVEIGPVVVFSPRALPQVTPFPEIGMGWGTELEWHDLRSLGMQLGIVDSVPVLHIAKPARTYDKAPEGVRLDRLLEDRGLSGMSPLQRTYRTYYAANGIRHRRSSSA
jgi:hypothetical protein